MMQVMVIVNVLPVSNETGGTPARKAILVAERTPRASRRVIFWGERAVRFISGIIPIAEHQYFV